MFFAEIKRLSDLLLSDEDDMVQKGLGWLLRETAKADAKRDRALFDENPPAGAAAGVENGMRDAAGRRSEEDSGETMVQLPNLDRRAVPRSCEIRPNSPTLLE